MTEKRKVYPNQRVLDIKKEPADKQHKFTCNNLEALGTAARRLQSKGGFKLYMYLAKNQAIENFVLYSSNFCEWSGLGIAAYNTAFNELVKEGFLIPKDETKVKETHFTFYDKSQKAAEGIAINIPKEKVKEIQEQIASVEEGFNF